MKALGPTAEPAPPATGRREMVPTLVRSGPMEGAGPPNQGAPSVLRATLTPVLAEGLNPYCVGLG